MRTGPYTAVRLVTLALLDGSPSDLKNALGSPTDKALVRAKYQAPRLLPAVLLASRGRTPNSSSAAPRRRGVFHWRRNRANAGRLVYAYPGPREGGRR